MEKRRLGRSELLVPPVVFGGNVFGWTVDEAVGFDLLDRMVEQGLTMIDTADVYSAWVAGHQGGESETLIGAWLASRGGRDRVILATKCGMRMGDGNRGLSARWIEQAVEHSLRRLRTDYIDLYQAHEPDPDVPLEETMTALARLVEAGKVRVLGNSNFSAAQTQAALEVSRDLGLPRFESTQPEFNLIARDGFEGPLADLCRREGIGAISYFALAAGFLTGKYRSEADVSGARAGRVSAYMTPRNMRILQTLLEVAEAEGVPPAVAAIAWIRAQPGITAPIASATSRAQLDELILAARHRLSPQSLARLNEAPSQGG
ncbi:aldo/keto reductase [Paracoccus sp. MKU1]|uniref:aldo/keto reductase n=1 Tax=Paracoccus sp. MKU1 TaxID=1745182 RepID=UPI00071941E8|nr:aldo/keto reductase [Paracoccus sp. MKU1]KRW93874.1 alcohol dehydrogenase [Paracoccus sp. MKU1]